MCNIDAAYIGEDMGAMIDACERRLRIKESMPDMLPESYARGHEAAPLDTGNGPGQSMQSVERRQAAPSVDYGSQWPCPQKGQSLRILIACACSGIMGAAFRALGHHAMECDLLPSEGDARYHMQCDVREVLSDGWDMMIAHPTCTRLTNAGSRWLQVPPHGRTQAQMWRELFDGAEFYQALRDAPIPLRAIENPIMHKHARELIQPAKRQVVQPWWFGDPFFKATGWELIGLPKLVATNKLTPPKKGTPEHKAWSAVHRASPGPDRAKERSRAFPGMAAACAAQWAGMALAKAEAA